MPFMRLMFRGLLRMMSVGLVTDIMDDAFSLAGYGTLAIAVSGAHFLIPAYWYYCHHIRHCLFIGLLNILIPVSEYGGWDI